MIDDRSVGDAIQSGAQIGAVVGGALVAVYLGWQVIVRHFLGLKEGISLNGGLSRLRGEVAEDNEHQLRGLEGRLLKQLKELRDELRADVNEVRQDVRTNKRESDARILELERERARRSR